jgi:hypothetical protein
MPFFENEEGKYEGTKGTGYRDNQSLISPSYLAN